MGSVRPVYFVDSPGATAFHHFLDCPALEQATHRVLKETIPEYATVVDTERRGELPLCLRCQNRVTDESATAEFRDRVASRSSAGGRSRSAAANGDSRVRLEEALVACFGDDEFGPEQLSGEEPIMIVKQDLAHLRVFSDRVEINHFAFAGGEAENVLPFPVIQEIGFERWIPLLRTPRVTFACADEDGEWVDHFVLDVRDDPEAVADLVRALWGAFLGDEPIEVEVEVEVKVEVEVDESSLPPPPEVEPAVAYSGDQMEGAPRTKMLTSKRKLPQPEMAEAASTAGEDRVRAKAMSSGPHRYPIIFLPGTAGSYLYMPTGANLDRPPKQLDDGTFADLSALGLRDWKIWLDAKDVVLRNDWLMANWEHWLALDRNGVDSVGFNIYPANIFEGPMKEFDFYSGLMRRLAADGFTEESGWLRRFPFDFRLSPEVNARRLDLLVRHTLRRTCAKKVVFVSHSQGGLIARTYIAQHRGAGVQASITIGTPWLGVVWVMKALGPLGWDFGQPGKVRPSVVRDVSQNWPAAYAMLPAEDWFRVHPDGFLSFVDRSTGYATRTPRDQIDFVMQHHNGSMYWSVRNGWRKSVFNGADYGVQNTIVVGNIPDSTPTRYVVEKVGNDYKEQLVNGPGDGTVTLASGSMSGCGSLIGAATRVHVVSRTDANGTRPEHSALAQHRDVQGIVAHEVAALQHA